MKREPRRENENLYRDRELRGRAERKSSKDRARRYREEKEYYYRSLKEHRYKGPEPEEPWEEDSFSWEEDDLYRTSPGRNAYDGREYHEERFQSAESRGRVVKDPWTDERYEGRRRTKKKCRGKKAAAVFLCILLAVVLAVLVIWLNPAWRKPAMKAVLTSPVGSVLGQIVYGGSYNRYVKDPEFDKSAIRINEGVSIPKGNRTIALFGIDARAEEIGSGTQADTILILNIDGDGNLKMASILRDTYLMSRTSSGEEVISKANSAFFRNGPEGAVNMLNENFDLAITDYAVVNFWGMANIIDELGGIRLTVTEEERLEMNFHMHEMHVYFGMKDVPLEASGEDILVNGDQATMFCRLRKIPFYSPVDGITYTDDYGRTARQRYVMSALVRQIREMGIFQLMSASGRLFAANAGEEKFIQSSLDVGELTAWLGLGADMQITGSESFPTADHLYTALLDSGDTVVADTLEENVQLLHAFLYNEEDYTPSEDLQAIAGRIRDEVARQQ